MTYDQPDKLKGKAERRIATNATNCSLTLARSPETDLPRALRRALLRALLRALHRRRALRRALPASEAGWEVTCSQELLDNDSVKEERKLLGSLSSGCTAIICIENDSSQT